MTVETLTQQLSAWSKGISSEVAFWEHWYLTQGGQWPEDYKQRLRRDREFDLALLHGLLIDNISRIKILDVGAGPLTVLGSISNSNQLDITACDALAPLYATLASKYKINPPITTQLAFAEDLTIFFKKEEFDFINCCNALDHCYDPVRAIEEMLMVVKIDGKIYLSHAVNEAETENYTGFHQWNFDKINEHFVIWNRKERYDVNNIFENFHEFRVEKLNESWLTVQIFKRTAGADDLSERHRSRLRTLLRALMNVLTASQE